MANKKETNLLVAVSNKLEELFNDCYFDLVGDIERKNKMYKFSTMFDFNFDSFNQFDNNGKLILDKHNLADDYVPVAVEGLIGELEPIPNTYIANVTIPLTFSVNLDKVNLTIEVIQMFIREAIGVIYPVDFVDYFSKENYKMVFMADLPDLSTFGIVQGQEVKEVTIDIAAVISNNVYWGNSIKYAISMNGENGNYQEIFKISPSTSKDKDLYTNQIIGQDYSKSSERTVSWTKSLTILGQNNELCNTLIKYVDFGYDAWGITKPDFWLKITYDNLGGTSVSKTKPIILNDISYTDDIGDFISISFSMGDRL